MILMIKVIKSTEDMISFGQMVGDNINCACVIELIGDVGAGKTTFVKGLAVGVGVAENVQSPSFTINREYSAKNNLFLSHYDFYRLSDAGVMTDELNESLAANNIVVIEWSDVVKNTLPQDRLIINITTIDENTRKLELSSGGAVSDSLLERIKR